MTSGHALPSVLLFVLLAPGCSGVSVESGHSRPFEPASPLTMQMSDADLFTFLANQPTQNDSSESKQHYEFAWDHILGPTAKARYESLAKAPCSFSIEEQVHFLKSGELKGDEELDKIYLTHYCTGRERSNKFMQATRIRLKQQYPNLSPNDIETLAADELEKERAQWLLERKLLSPSRGLACTSNRVGGSTYTDCY